MTKEQLNEILEKHKKWINDEPGGERADLREADLQTADLRGADLQTADLRGAHLQGADLWGADLRGANLRGAHLQGANNIPNYVCPICCPEEGSFIGFKKAYWNNTPVIVKLQIPADAKRSSATTRKCRCSKATVISITDMLDVDKFQMAVSSYDKNFIYEVGKTVIVDDYDDNRWNECSTGIHFFITRDEAVRY